MRFLRWGFLLAGLVLLAIVAGETDLAEAMRLVGHMGWGIALIFAIYLVGFAGDVATALLTLRIMPLQLSWYGRMWLVRMMGEAFNYTLPAGGMGGEPIKAVLLHRHFGVPYRDGAASLLMTKTVNDVALSVFLAVGSVMMQGNPRLPDAYGVVAGVGLGALVAGISGFFTVQRFGLSSAFAARVPDWAGGRKLAGVTQLLRDLESRFRDFYAGGPARFGTALAIAFAVWVVGAVEIYVTLDWLGHPVTWQEAWIIEAAAQLVRAGTFFIPASIGAQEGAFVVLSSAITGSPAVGVAVAVVRRLREIVWFGLGFAVGPLVPRVARRVDE